jgi:hypothetical protein
MQQNFFKLLFDFLKRNHFVFGVLFCASLIPVKGFSQQDDSLKYKLEHFDSLEYDDQREVAIAYLETDLNYNSANNFILWYYDFLSLFDDERYKNIFLNTSFPTEELQEDSLYFLLRINLDDDHIEEAEATYHFMKESSNKNIYLSGLELSNYYFDSNPKKSLEYHKDFFTFNVTKYVTTKGETPSYWRRVNDYFRLLAYNEKHETIIEYCDSILPFKPDDEEWLERKADAQFALEKYEEASITYHRLYKLNNTISHLQRLMYTFMNVDDTVSALNMLRENIELRGEKDLESRHLYHNYLEKYNLHELRDSLILDVLKKEPEFYISLVPSESFYYYSLFQASNQQLNEAIKTMFRGIEMVDSTNTEFPYKSNSFPPSFYSVYNYYIRNEDGTFFISKYYNLIGWLYTQKGKNIKSIKSHRKALDFYDCNPNSNYRLAYLYKNSFWKNKKKAISYYEKIASCDVFGWSNYYAISELAWNYYFKKNNYEKAKELLLSIIAYGELKSHDYQILSRIYKAEKNYSEAIIMIDKAIAFGDNEWDIEYYKSIKERIEELRRQE